MLITQILYYIRMYFCLALKDCFIRERMRIPSNETKERMSAIVHHVYQSEKFHSCLSRQANQCCRKIMSCIVASKSHSKYKNDNTTFILWLYDDQDLREKFLQDWFVM